MTSEPSLFVLVAVALMACGAVVCTDPATIPGAFPPENVYCNGVLYTPLPSQSKTVDGTDVMEKEPPDIVDPALWFNVHPSTAMFLSGTM
jgi:hypothetical protein